MPSIMLRDGRALFYRDYGDAAGKPVIALHGMPGAGLKFACSGAAAERAGLRLICPDRWGYGGSSAPAARSLAAYAADAAELADALGIGSFAVLGVSGGGPFAVATAIELGVRVSRLALVCPVGLVAAADGEPISPFHRLSFRVLPRMPGALRLTFEAYRAVVRTCPGLAVRVAAARACADDRRILRDVRVRTGLADTFRDGMRGGVAGCVIDMALFARPWGLDLARSGRARVWMGTKDGNVPARAAISLARAIDAELTEMKDRGHFWIAGDDHDVWAWLANA